MPLPAPQLMPPAYEVVKRLAVASGGVALLLALVYVFLVWYVQKRKRERKQARRTAKDPSSARAADVGAEAVGASHGASQFTVDGAQPAIRRKNAKSGGEQQRAPSFSAGPIARDPAVVRAEQELKRDALHLFRRMHAATSVEEKSPMCSEACKLFDNIENRMGSGMAAITCGRIVFCNALMEVGGLDDLRECQDAQDPDAVRLVERIVPIIFST